MNMEKNFFVNKAKYLIGILIINVIVGLSFPKNICAWDFEEHVEIGREAYIKACDDLNKKFDNYEKRDSIKKSEFQNKELITKLIKEKIIKEDKEKPERIIFDDSITDEKELEKRLTQKKISQIEAILSIWHKYKEIIRLNIACRTIGYEKENKNNYYYASIFGQACALAGDHLNAPEEYFEKIVGRKTNSFWEFTEIARTNSDHFHPHAPRKWQHYHQKALVEAKKASTKQPPEAFTSFELSLAVEAFAEHFLQDSFSSGHMGFNREASGIGPSRIFHDYWNLKGRFVADKNDWVKKWRIYGDGTYGTFTEKNFTDAYDLIFASDFPHDTDYDSVLILQGAGIVKTFREIDTYREDTTLVQFINPSKKDKEHLILGLKEIVTNPKVQQSILELFKKEHLILRLKRLKEIVTNPKFQQSILELWTQSRPLWIQSELFPRLINGTVAKSNFQDNDLKKLLKEKIIKDFNNYSDYIYFSGFLKKEEQLIKRIKQIKGIDIDSILNNWRQSLKPKIIKQIKCEKLRKILNPSRFYEVLNPNRIIKIIRNPKCDRFIFNDSIKTDEELRKRLKKNKIINTKPVFDVWHNPLLFTAKKSIENFIYAYITSGKYDPKKEREIVNSIPALVLNKDLMDKLELGKAYWKYIWNLENRENYNKDVILISDPWQEDEHTQKDEKEWETTQEIRNPVRTLATFEAGGSINNSPQEDSEQPNWGGVVRLNFYLHPFVKLNIGGIYEDDYPIEKINLGLNFPLITSLDGLFTHSMTLGWNIELVPKKGTKYLGYRLDFDTSSFYTYFFTELSIATRDIENISSDNIGFFGLFGIGFNLPISSNYIGGDIKKSDAFK